MSLAQDILRRMASRKETETCHPEAEAETVRATPKRRAKTSRTNRKPDLNYTNSTKPWSAKENARLTHLVTVKKLGSAEISEIMGRSPQAIKTQCCRMDISMATTRGRYYKPTGDEIKTIVKLYKQGLTARQIGAKMNLTENQIRGHITASGKRNRNHEWTLPEEAMVTIYYPALSLEELGKILGIKPGAIKSRRSRIVYAGRRAAVLARPLTAENDKVAKYLIAKGLDPADYSILSSSHADDNA